MKKHFLMLAVGMAMTALGAETNLSHVVWTKVVSGEDDRYCGWPTVTAVGPQELVAVFSGGRSNHICPWGRVKLIRSSDGGETWSASVDVANGPLDNRDAGLVRLANGDWLTFYFTSLAYLHPSCLKSNPDWKRHYEKLPRQLVLNELGSFAVRSSDGGRTWSEKMRVPVTAPHGGILLRDGRLLMIGNSFTLVRGHLGDEPEEKGHEDDSRYLLAAESTDGGRSWRVLSRIDPDKTVKGGMYEPHLIEGTDGVIRCYIRNVDIAYSESRDGGKTWTAATHKWILGWDNPPHLMRLQDGRVLFTGARRSNKKDNPAHSLSVFAKIGDADGKPASIENAAEIPLYYPPGTDMGYASTAQLGDGSLVTVFYAHHGGSPAKVVAVKWRLPR